MSINPITRSGCVTYQPSFECDARIYVEWFVSKGFVSFAVHECSDDTNNTTQLQSAGGFSAAYLGDSNVTKAHEAAGEIDCRARAVVNGWIAKGEESGFLRPDSEDVLADGDLYSQIDSAIFEVTF